MTTVVAFVIGLAVAAPASADPVNGDQPPGPPPGPAAIAAPPAGNSAPATAACNRFGAALRVSSTYYNEFAYSIAGDGAHVEYQDPAVMNANVDGRAALRKSAAEALSASGTPGLQPEIASPMRSWALRATKLLLTMGLRGNGATLNNAATELNREATDTQLACAQAGTPA